MRIEIDISLENPSEIIDLTIVRRVLQSNINYKILQHLPNNYLLLQNEDYKIRIHEDGRIYIKMEEFNNNTFKDNILEILLKNLKSFLHEFQFINHDALKNEINISFFGSTAHSIFWEKCNEINEIGREVLTIFDLRTYAPNHESIYAKLESLNPIII